MKMHFDSDGSASGPVASTGIASIVLGHIRFGSLL